MSRKDRKARVIQLTREWVDVMYSDRGKATNWNGKELVELYQIFCREKRINKPQDATLREQIVILTEQVFEEAEKIKKAKESK